MLANFIILVTKSTIVLTVLINILVSASILLLTRYKFTKQNNDSLEIQLNNKALKLKNLFEAKFSPNTNMIQYLNRDDLGVTGLSSWLHDNWEQFNDNQRKRYSLAVVKNTDKMIGFMNNILDFATLNKDKFHLKIETINLTKLILERAEQCSKLYQDHKNLEFCYDLEPEINIKGDRYLIKQAIDNLIINALNCNKSEIYIKLASTQIVMPNNLDQNENIRAVEFIIQDQQRFLSFNKSPRSANYYKNHFADPGQKHQISNKEIKNNRDISLALCKKIIEIHNGFMDVNNLATASNNDFKFLLPV